jgi:hypothetical protein
MKPVMISCKQRLNERELTLKQLDAVGIAPTVIEYACEPPSIENNRHGAYTAAKMAYNNKSGLLFLEDDIDVNAPLFEVALNAAVRDEVLTTFILFRETLYGESIKGAVRGRQCSFVKLVDDLVAARRGFHGSQALYLPPYAVERVLQDKNNFVDDNENVLPLGSIEHGFDFWIKDHARELGGLFCVYPNPIQHRGPTSTFGGADMSRFRSRSYDAGVKAWL